MRKSLMFIFVAVLIASELALLSCFHTDFANSYVTETSAIVLSKIKYAFLRAYIEIQVTSIYGPVTPTVTLIFPDGSQRAVVGRYSFEVFLDRTGNPSGGFGIGSPSTGVELSDLKPISVAVMSNVTDSFFTDTRSLMPVIDRIDVYMIKIQGAAEVKVRGYGLGI